MNLPANLYTTEPLIGFEGHPHDLQNPDCELVAWNDTHAQLEQTKAGELILIPHLQTTLERVVKEFRHLADQAKHKTHPDFLILREARAVAQELFHYCEDAEELR